ncbi:peptidoglycan DD-metalloendopeptidase family protein [Ruminococcus sp.]|uniref:peptidoglycan DD-metalloendopeptidase family protein n=1 Tax=Ruminococcus sp. TaxID=41978 RepID=UPI0025D28008|nr:peptidoglycan DD-metalloendopeptidase family protein [Ruminococcus sp.]MCR4637947.1 peptidoglycan DD-metalloendopeptidase family protein [Ruminococcus sp.]
MITKTKRAAAIIAALFMILTILMIYPFGLSAHAAAYAVWPTEARFKNITTYFDAARNVNDVSGYHNGIDIEADGGSNIYAAVGGKVVSAEWMDAYGYTVIIQHPDLGVYTFYAHASQVVTSAGAQVNQGDVIAKVGSTGNSSGNHLHFGICDSLQAGWPARTYYDPTTYFVYSDNNGGGNSVLGTSKTDSGFSEEYAGEYTTKGVVTYLNIRADHNTSSAVVGEIPAGAEFTVTSANGEWAKVEYNGKKGFSSMTYMEKKSELHSEIKIENVTAPEGTLEKGKTFSIKGNITSNLIITKVYGGVYFRSGEATSQCAEAAPNTIKYDLSSYFDKNIAFNALNDGEYTYKITAEDKSGNSVELVKTDFIISSDVFSGVLGDLNDDSKLNVSDIVTLQSYILGKNKEFTKKQYLASDLNKDGAVDIFDLTALKKAVVKATV